MTFITLLTAMRKQAHTCSGPKFCLETFSFFLFPNLGKILFSITSKSNSTSKTTEYWARDPAVQTMSKVVTSTICEVTPDFPHFLTVQPLVYSSQPVLPWDFNEKVSALRGARGGWEHKEHAHTLFHALCSQALPQLPSFVRWCVCGGVCIYTAKTSLKWFT